MTSPSDVAQFHADYDQHTDDRIRLFQTIAGLLPPSTQVLYPASYVDIAPSVWFDDVTYVDTDKRARQFFDETDALANLGAKKRRSASAPAGSPTITFHHLDYRQPLPIEPGSVGLLISL